MLKSLKEKCAGINCEACRHHVQSAVNLGFINSKSTRTEKERGGTLLATLMGHFGAHNGIPYATIYSGVKNMVGRGTLELEVNDEAISARGRVY